MEMPSSAARSHIRSSLRTPVRAVQAGRGPYLDHTAYSSCQGSPPPNSSHAIQTSGSVFMCHLLSTWKEMTVTSFLTFVQPMIQNRPDRRSAPAS